MRKKLGELTISTLHLEGGEWGRAHMTAHVMVEVDKINQSRVSDGEPGLIAYEEIVERIYDRYFGVVETGRCSGAFTSHIRAIYCDYIEVQFV